MSCASENPSNVAALSLQPGSMGPKVEASIDFVTATGGRAVIGSVHEAAAVIAGSAVILFDPIFQGLAISLMAGEVASLLLSRVTVPVLYYVAAKRRLQRAVPAAVEPSPEVLV